MGGVGTRVGDKLNEGSMLGALLDESVGAVLIEGSELGADVGWGVAKRMLSVVTWSAQAGASKRVRTALGKPSLPSRSTKETW